LPLCAISLPSDGVGSTIVEGNRLFSTKPPPLKSLVPGKGASDAILPSEFYGEIGQDASAMTGIHILPTSNSFSHKAAADFVLSDAFFVGHGH
jgi:hypothetical protein